MDDETNRLGALLAHVRTRFDLGGLEDPAAEARILVGGILGLTLTDLVSRRDMPVGAEDEARLHQAVGRRLAGEPPYRILGHRGFFDLDLSLNRATLEPRPDTETVVETVLDLVSARRDEPLRILDLGTGTGAICLALLAHLPRATGIGSDLAAEALVAALANAGTHGLGDRFSAIESRWFDRIDGLFDIIVSNPPYIRSDVIPTLDREVRDHDPLLALDGGADGLDAYRAIAAGASRHLSEGGLLALEIGFDQCQAVTMIFEQAGFERLRAVRDLSGHDRALAFGSNR